MSQRKESVETKRISTIVFSFKGLMKIKASNVVCTKGKVKWFLKMF